MHRVRAMLKSGLLLVALATTAVLAAGPAGAAPRACTSDDLAGSRAPAMLRDHGLDTQDGPLVAGTKYRVVVVQELAIGDNAQPVDGSISVSAPNGPALDPTTEDDRPAYDFTPAKAGKVTLVVNWEDEVGSRGSGDICAASQSFDIPVLEPTKPTLTSAFHPGPRTFESSFTLRLKGKKPQDPAKVSVLVRARRGTTKPPAPRGSALAHFTYKPNGFGGFDIKGSGRQLRGTAYIDNVDGAVKIYPYGNAPIGRTTRFAFSIEVLQHGKRLGGMRSGAKCKRIQFTGHSAVKCKAVGLKQRP
jgi:hypothetical protein